MKKREDQKLNERRTSNCNESILTSHHFCSHFRNPKRHRCSQQQVIGGQPWKIWIMKSFYYLLMTRKCNQISPCALSLENEDLSLQPHGEDQQLGFPCCDCAIIENIQSTNYQQRKFLYKKNMIFKFITSRITSLIAMQDGIHYNFTSPSAIAKAKLGFCFAMVFNS